MTVGRLARAAAIVAIFGLVSRLLGFAREIVLAASFGATEATDAFVSSLLIVNAIAAILLYTLVTLIIPVFQRERAERGTESAWRLVSALAVWVGIFLIALSSIVAIWPEAFAALFRLDASREAQTAELIRIMAPALALQGFSAIFTAMLQIHGRFAGPAAVGVAFNLGIIVGVIVGRGSIGIEAAGWGSWWAPRSRCCSRCRSSRGSCAMRARAPPWTHPGLGAVGLLALPVAGASVLQQVNNFTDKLFASSLEAGRVSALSFANALGQAPRVALLLPLLTPLFPLIARLVSEGREGEALGAFRRVAGLLALVSIPMTVMLTVYAQETAQLAFGRGKCGADCVDEIGAPLAFYALALWPAFTSALLNRTLSAANRQRDILWATIITVVLTILFDILLLGPMEQSGLALAASIGVFANAATLLYCLRRHFPSLSLAGLGRRDARVLVAGAAAAAVALGLNVVLPTADLTSIEMLVPLAFKVVVSAAVYLLVARALARDELAEARRALRALVARDRPAR